MGTTITEKEAPIVDLGPMILRSHNELYDDNDGWNCVCFLPTHSPNGEGISNSQLHKWCTPWSKIRRVFISIHCSRYEIDIPDPSSYLST